MSDEVDEGFDEGAELTADDLVVLQQDDGTEVACVLLAVVEHEGSTYALLEPRSSLDGDRAEELLVARYDEDASGAARFGVVEDEAVLTALEGVVDGLMSWGDED